MATLECNVNDFVLSASALSSHNLDLSRKGIRELPADLPGCETLECLYLEGNKITTLPESLFVCCPNLRWLDLRNNQLTSIPSSIDKLRHLRTLLLEGNRLTSLPPQLSKLRQLTGLNLSNNPLEMPPKHIIQRGTKGVLKYLQELLNEECSEDLVEPNTKSSTESRSPLVLASIDNNACLVQCTSSRHPVRAFPDPNAKKLGLPLPVLQQIPLSGSRHQPRKAKYYTKVQEATPSDQHRTSIVKRKRGARNKAKEENGRQQPILELTPEEKVEINITIETKKAKEGLAAWRDEARELQRRQKIWVSVGGPESLNYQRAELMAPFATDSTANNSSDRLKVTDEQPVSLSAPSTDSLREVREAEVKARVNKHILELAALRKQTGLIASPSDELLEAEKKLAEAIVRHKDVEREKAREYRLTAFTGD